MKLKLKTIFMLAAISFVPSLAKATSPIYQLDGKEGNWSAFHYSDSLTNKTTACFALSNDLSLGFKSNSEGVGLVTWKKQNDLQPKKDLEFAITVQKQHFVFTMQAMDKNMLMNRLNVNDFKQLLEALSFGQVAVLEYPAQPVSVVSLEGLPNMLVKFHQCINNANFKEYK